MTHGFDQQYWDKHWAERPGGSPGQMAGAPANPYVVAAAAGLGPGRALDAGCGAGGEAIWLAQRNWQVTAVDLSQDALDRAAIRGTESGVADRIDWVQADLTSWQPGRQFDLVMTNYAHPTIPHVAFYQRLGDWVVPGGTLLIVGHQRSGSHGQGQHGGGHGHGHPVREQGQHESHLHGRSDHHDPLQPPAEASVTVQDIVAGLALSHWRIEQAEERVRAVGSGESARELQDVVVRAVRSV